MPLEKKQKFLFRGKQRGAECKKLPGLDIDMLLNWAQIDGGLWWNVERIFPQPRWLATMLQEMLQRDRTGMLTDVVFVQGVENSSVIPPRSNVRGVFFLSFSTARPNCNLWAIIKYEIHIFIISSSSLPGILQTNFWPPPGWLASSY